MANDLNQIFFTMFEENGDKLADDGPTAALCRAPVVNFIDLVPTAVWSVARRLEFCCVAPSRE